MLLTAKILLTIITLGYSAIPSFFDFNKTHVTNPSWTGHARYHVVWQVSTFNILGVLALYLIWTSGVNVAQLWIPLIIAAAAYAGFWTACFTRPLYNGVLQDEVNGVPEFHYNIFGKKFSVDANISLFTPITLFTVVTFFLLLKLTTGS